MANHHVEMRCSFCGGAQRDGLRLLAGPLDYLCSRCLGDAEAAFAEASGVVEARCAFCGKDGPSFQSKLESARRRDALPAICAGCADLAHDILHLFPRENPACRRGGAAGRA